MLCELLLRRLSTPAYPVRSFFIPLNVRLACPHVRAALTPFADNTARPLNLNYSDLSRTEWRTVAPAPPSVLTDASFEIAQAKFAAQVRRALDELVLSSAPKSYVAVLEHDRVSCSTKTRRRN